VWHKVKAEDVDRSVDGSRKEWEGMVQGGGVECFCGAGELRFWDPRD
jgi:hypothetical protein